MCLRCSWVFHLMGLRVKAALGEDFIFSCSLVLWPFSWLDMCPSDNPRASWLPASPRCQKHVPTSSPLTWWSLRGLIHYNSEKLHLTHSWGSEARSWWRPPDVIVIAITIKNLPWQNEKGTIKLKSGFSHSFRKNVAKQQLHSYKNWPSASCRQCSWLSKSSWLQVLLMPTES